MLGLCFIALALPHPAVTVVALAASGALSMTLNVMNVSHCQTSIPEGLFGRVNAAYRWIIWGVLPLGSLAAGVLSWLLFLGHGGGVRLVGHGWVLAGSGAPPHLDQPEVLLGGAAAQAAGPVRGAASASQAATAPSTVRCSWAAVAPSLDWIDSPFNTVL